MDQQTYINFLIGAIGGGIGWWVNNIWATAKQWTAQQATDDIMATADEWYAALDKIRDLRLNAKENVRRVTGVAADIDAIVAQFMTELSTLMKGLA